MTIITTQHICSKMWFWSLHNMVWRWLQTAGRILGVHAHRAQRYHYIYIFVFTCSNFLLWLLHYTVLVLAITTHRRKSRSRKHPSYPNAPREYQDPNLPLQLKDCLFRPPDSIRYIYTHKQKHQHTWTYTQKKVMSFEWLDTNSKDMSAA